MMIWMQESFKEWMASDDRLLGIFDNGVQASKVFHDYFYHSLEQLFESLVNGNLRTGILYRPLESFQEILIKIID